MEEKALKKKIVSLLIAGVLTAGSTSVCMAEEAGSEMVYGTLNLSYADYYYGELNNVEPEDPAQSTQGQYDAADPVTAAGYEEEGMYDAVTSATTQKSKGFESTFTEDVETGVNILGVSNVNVAISKALYDDVQKAIEEGKECSNSLIEFVQNMENVSETAPAEYKVINSDGTISKTVGNTVKAENVETSITTTTAWGNYQITVEGLEVDANTVQGVVFETDDGSKYGLEHLDNIWLRASELGVAVKEFQEPHGNQVAYQRFTDLPGKTITKITYLVANADDIEIDTSLFCKLQLSDEYSISSADSVSYNPEGTEIAAEMNMPEDSNYVLSSVKKGRAVMEEGTYEASENGVVLSPDCKPGSYTVIFSDETYADIQVTCLVTSDLTAEDITFDGSVLSVAENAQGLTLADYLAAISSVSVNGETVGQSVGTIIFNEDGTVNPDAVISSRSGETVVFAGEEGDSYILSMEATGFPSIEITVTP